MSQNNNKQFQIQLFCSLFILVMSLFYENMYQYAQLMQGRTFNILYLLSFQCISHLLVGGAIAFVCCSSDFSKQRIYLLAGMSILTFFIAIGKLFLYFHDGSFLPYGLTLHCLLTGVFFVSFVFAHSCYKKTLKNTN